MATRQYIGARYVPKFYTNSVDGSAAWESNVVYEPLTYVTLTNGHMYISKKEVPATVGTPASNITYWLDCGSYNGFIDDLQNQINTLSANKGDKAAIGTIETLGSAPSRTYYGGEVFLGNDGNEYVVTETSIVPPTVLNSGAGGNCVQTTINSELNKLNITTIPALSLEIELLKNKSYVVISDSYGNYLDSNNKNFVESAFAKVGISDYYDFHYGGAGFVGNATSFLYVLQLYESAITDKNKITDIIVCGAANDMNKSAADLLTQMNAFKSYVNSHYPNAKISVMALSRSVAADVVQYNPSVNERYKRCCSDAGLAFVDNSEWVMSKMSYFSSVDAVHPTADGVTACARALADYIMNGTISVVESIDGFVKLIDANDGTLVNYSKQEFINGICSIKSKGNAGSIFVNFSTSISLNAGANVVSNKFDFADTFIFPTANNSLIITIQISCGSDVYDGYLYFGSMTDYLHHHVGLIINNRYGTTKTITGPTSIGIGATSFSIFA